MKQSNASIEDNPHPWRRYFAKFVDMCALGLVPFMLLMLGIGFLSPQQSEDLAKVLDNQIISGLVLLVVWIPAEAIFLALLGGTPGRWLFGISVQDSNRQRLSFGKALERSLLVAIQGMGAGIPIVALFTHIFAYRRLTGTGTTLWDVSVGSKVAHVEWGAIRAVLAVLVTMLAFFFVVILTAMGNSG